MSSPDRHLFSTSIEAEGAELAMPLWLWSSGLCWEREVPGMPLLSWGVLL